MRQPCCAPDYSKQSDYPDENFAKKLKQSLEEAIKLGARPVFANNWKTQTIRLRLASWLSYGLVRFMVGMAGYAQGKQSGHISHELGRGL